MYLALDMVNAMLMMTIQTLNVHVTQDQNKETTGMEDVVTVMKYTLVLVMVNAMTIRVNVFVTMVVYKQI